MKRERKLVIILIVIVLLGLLWVPGNAQRQDAQWTGPIQLSSSDSSVFYKTGVLTGDEFGWAHVFWAEQMVDQRKVIMYARFDGQTWTTPVDISIISSATVGFGRIAEPVIDDQGFIYLAYTESANGPIKLIYAHITEALSAKNWSSPISFPYTANTMGLAVDRNRVLHMVYLDQAQGSQGVYYIRSEDRGQNWTAPLWFDPDIPANAKAFELEFELDETTNSLHAAWQYLKSMEGGQFIGGAIRFITSPDLGETWLPIVDIDTPDEEIAELRGNEFSMASGSGQVHIVWAGTSNLLREHVFSLDAGRTWSVPSRVFGSLVGAAGETMEMDEEGNVYFLGQIRYPQGLYFISNTRGAWNSPVLIYLIARNSSEPIGDRIHIHGVEATVLSGNQLITVFTNSPGDSDLTLYAMYRALDDPSFIPPRALPTLTPMPSPTVGPTIEPTIEVTPTYDFDSTDLGDDLDASLIVPMSILITILTIGVMVGGWYFRNSRRS